MSSKIKRVQVFEAPSADAAKALALVKQGAGWQVQWASAQGPGKWLVQLAEAA